MPLRVVVVSRPRGDDGVLRSIYEIISARREPNVHCYRCDSSEDLDRIVRDACRSYGYIEFLDLIGHGAAGVFALGDRNLFDTSYKFDEPLKNAPIARGLCRYLRETAQVRILGCNTGGAAFMLDPRPRPATPFQPELNDNDEMHGRALLTKLGIEFGPHRVVYAPIDWLDDFDYSSKRPLGSEAMNMSMLLSSDQTVDSGTTRTARIYRMRDYFDPYFRTRPTPKYQRRDRSRDAVFDTVTTALFRMLRIGH